MQEDGLKFRRQPGTGKTAFPRFTALKAIAFLSTSLTRRYCPSEFWIHVCSTFERRVTWLLRRLDKQKCPTTIFRMLGIMLGHTSCGSGNLHECILVGGRGGIRTRGGYNPTYAFQAYDLNRSSTLPQAHDCSSARSAERLALLQRA